MSLKVWTERQKGKWTDCIFSAYGMALEYAGFSKFPLGSGTAAEREAFAGPYNDNPKGSTLKQADARAAARYGVKLATLPTNSLENALKTKRNTAFVIVGNYKGLNTNSILVRDVYAWNRYDKKHALPSVEHAVTVVVDESGNLTWYDPTAPNGTTGISTTIAEVMAFNKAG